MILEYCSYLLTRIFLTTCGVVLIEIFGSTALAYQVLFILIAIDFATGFLGAWISKDVSSNKMWKGVVKMFTCFCLVLAAHQLVRLTGFVKWVEDGVVMYLASMQFISILENAARLGVPVPLWIKEKLLTYVENGLQKN